MLGSKRASSFDIPTVDDECRRSLLHQQQRVRRSKIRQITDIEGITHKERRQSLGSQNLLESRNARCFWHSGRVARKHILCYHEGKSMHTPNRTIGWISSATLAASLWVQTASAQVFNGPGLQGGLAAAGGLAGLPTGDVRSIIIRILSTVLSFLALAAVITIIIAGIILIVSLGNEESKDRAKRIIFYTLIGLAVVLFARVIVGIVTVYLASEIV